jgi:hypothetical protein
LQLERRTEREQPLLVRAHEMHHWLTTEAMPMKPNAAVKGEAHALAAARELPIGGLY